MNATTRVGLTIFLLTIACCATSKPALVAADDDCGDMVDPADACPLTDSCPNSPGARTAETDDDGCPGHGGVPFATACNSDARRLEQIASALGQTPKLTTLRITSSVTGCADALRSGLERVGVAHERLETFTPSTHSATHCDRWGYFSVASWDGALCPVPGARE